MFYIQSIGVPFLIAICLYFIQRPRSGESILNYGLLLVIILFAYSVVVYKLEMAHIWTTGWVFYSLIFFLIPISVVLIILKVISLWRKGRKPIETDHIKRASIYKFDQKGYVLHASRKAKSGFGLAGDPFIRISENAGAMDILNAIESCLIFDDSERVADPGREEWVEYERVFLQKMGIRSLNELHKRTVKHCSIMMKDDTFSFTPWDHAVKLKEGFILSKADPVIVPYNASAEEILNSLEIAFSRCE